MEWKKIKTSEQLVKAEIDKYLQVVSPAEKKENAEKPPTNERKRALSSDDEHDPVDFDLEGEVVETVEPTFTLRDSTQPTEFNDTNKPWVALSMERAKARNEARLAKIRARRLASENRIKTPVQEGVIQQIKEISERIASLVQVKNMGLSTAESNDTLKKLLQQKKERTSELSRLKSKQLSSARYRQRKKQSVETICSIDPEVAAELSKHYKPATLRVQRDNTCPDLIQTLEEIARIGRAADTNHRLINVQPCTSLDELRSKIKERGYEIRRSSSFYRYERVTSFSPPRILSRLIPSGIFTQDGKRHVTSGPVRLRRLQGVEQAKHEGRTS